MTVAKNSAGRENARREGERVYQTIKASGLTLTEIARRLDKSPQNLCMTLKRVRDGRLTLKTLAALGLAIGVYWDLVFVDDLDPNWSADGMSTLLLAA